MSRSSAAGLRTIYVGNLPGDTRQREIEDLFYKFGRIVDIDLKIPPRPPGYAFVEFDDERDADEAIRHRDGYDFDGHKLRVELAHGGGYRVGFEPYGSRVGGRPPGAVSKRSEYRVTVTGLPASASWQDLKDHMRKAGDVCFTQVFRDGKGTMGIVDYTNYDDMKYAIRKLDDTEFRNPFSRGCIRVREDRSAGGPAAARGRSHSRTPSRSYSRSASRSRSRSRSPASRSRSPDRRSRSRSRSRSRGRSLSRSRSRSRSPSARPQAASRSASRSP